MKIKRPFLLLFSPIYATIVWLRNLLFDFGILKSKSFTLPVIAIGNLNVGGTGKTPHTLWVLYLLKNQKTTGVVSRGYGRSSKGFVLAQVNSTASEIGDEPKEILNRFPESPLAVAEKRVEGIEGLLRAKPETEAVVLDDAFQHRYVKAGLTILLTTQNDRYTKDYVLPGGNLRESKAGSKRADIIIVTKCNPILDALERDKIIAELNPQPNQIVGFSYFDYGKPLDAKFQQCSLPNRFLLLTAIAQTNYLEDYLKSNKCDFEHLKFKDHHAFNDSDYEAMKAHCAQFGTDTLLTTAKDFARLNTSHKAIEKLKILQLPISVKFHYGGEGIEQQILSFVLSN